MCCVNLTFSIIVIVILNSIIKCNIVSELLIVYDTFFPTANTLISYIEAPIFNGKNNIVTCSPIFPFLKLFIGKFLQQEIIWKICMAKLNDNVVYDILFFIFHDTY